MPSRSDFLQLQLSSGRTRIGEIAISSTLDGFTLHHHLDLAANGLTISTDPEAALEQLGWRLGAQAYTFRALTLYETIDTLNALGIKYEIRPFADHTVHLTLRAARELFKGLPVRFVTETDDIAENSTFPPDSPRATLPQKLKRKFFKNALYRLIAVREA